MNWSKVKEGTLLVISWDDIISRSVWLPDGKLNSLTVSRLGSLLMTTNLTLG